MALSDVEVRANPGSYLVDLEVFDQYSETGASLLPQEARKLAITLLYFADIAEKED